MTAHVTGKPRRGGAKACALRLHRFFVAMACIAMAASLAAADWPQWRGPNRDGSGVVVTAPAAWPEKLTTGWTVTIGGGHASPVLVGERLYLHSREQENEVVSALDARTGKILWQDRYPAPYRVNSAAASHGPGPKSTPAVADGRVFTLGISGILSALDASTGKVLWRKPAPPTTPIYGTAMSPVADGGLVIAHVGGHDNGALTAFDAATGDERWRWAGDGPGYASPVIGTFGGTRQVVTQSQNRLIAVAARDGQLLWEIPLRTPYDQNSVTPLVYRDTVIYSGLEQPLSAVRPVNKGGKWVAEKVWENTGAGMYMSSPVPVGTTLYGLSHRNRGHFFAVDATTGKTLWATRGREAENAAIVAGGNLLFMLQNHGELIVARANPGSFDAVRRYTVADSPTWAHPVIDRHRIFIRDAASIRMWTIQ